LRRRRSHIISATWTRNEVAMMSRWLAAGGLYGSWMASISQYFKACRPIPMLPRTWTPPRVSPTPIKPHLCVPAPSSVSANHLAEIPNPLLKDLCIIVLCAALIIVRMASQSQSPSATWASLPSHAGIRIWIWLQNEASALCFFYVAHSFHITRHLATTMAMEYDGHSNLFWAQNCLLIAPFPLCCTRSDSEGYGHLKAIYVLIVDCAKSALRCRWFLRFLSFLNFRKL